MTLEREAANPFLLVLTLKGPTDEDELRRIGREVDGRLVYNFVGDLGSSPYVDLSALEGWGFDIVLFSVTATLSTIANVYADFSAFAANPVDAMRRIDDTFNEQPLGSLHEFSGFPEVVEWEEQYLPDEEQERYDRSLGDDIA